MPDPATITIPRLEGESNRAYDARVRYVTMGPDRSIEKIGQQLGYKGATPPGHVTRWSQQYQWFESARRYDDAVAYVTIQESAAQYRKDLEDHRERYGKAGRSLYTLATAYMNKLAQRIKDLDSEEIKPSRLALDVRTAAAALTIAADLEAHALRVADLLPRLADDSGQ
jgi:hypothetical protein